MNRTLFDRFSLFYKLDRAARTGTGHCCKFYARGLFETQRCQALFVSPSTLDPISLSWIGNLPETAFELGVLDVAHCHGSKFAGISGSGANLNFVLEGCRRIASEALIPIVLQAPGPDDVVG